MVKGWQVGCRRNSCTVRNIIHYLDPISTSLRWAPCIQRRPYSVPGSNALWHLGIE